MNENIVYVEVEVAHDCYYLGLNAKEFHDLHMETCDTLRETRRELKAAERRITALQRALIKLAMDGEQ